MSRQISLSHPMSDVPNEERYTSQTKKDYTGAPVAPFEPHEFTRKPHGATTIVLGYDKEVSAVTEARSQFTAKLSPQARSPTTETLSPARVVSGLMQPSGKATVRPQFSVKDAIQNTIYPADEPFATEQRKFGWEAGAHRAGITALETCKTVSRALNQTRFVLGDAAASYETSSEGALAATIEQMEATGEKRVVPRRLPEQQHSPGSVSREQDGNSQQAELLRPGHLIHYGDDVPSYSTTAQMQRTDGVSSGEGGGGVGGVCACVCVCVGGCFERVFGGGVV
jgi:hypothetical protein